MARVLNKLRNNLILSDTEKKTLCRHLPDHYKYNINKQQDWQQLSWKVKFDSVQEFSYCVILLTWR